MFCAYFLWDVLRHLSVPGGFFCLLLRVSLCTQCFCFVFSLFVWCVYMLHLACLCLFFFFVRLLVFEACLPSCFIRCFSICILDLASVIFSMVFCFLCAVLFCIWSLLLLHFDPFLVFILIFVSLVYKFCSSCLSCIVLLELYSPCLQILLFVPFLCCVVGVLLCLYIFFLL